MPTRDKSSWNRDDQQKPGSPPTSAAAPGRGAKTSKTATDPASGAKKAGGPTPNQAATDQTDGVKR